MSERDRNLPVKGPGWNFTGAPAATLSAGSKFLICSSAEEIQRQDGQLPDGDQQIAE